VHILYLSQYFPPEIGATQTRAMEMARGLARAGHRVTVVTEFPNHPSGVIPPEYRRKLFERERVDGVEVIRVWVKASPNKTFGKRMAFYLSFMVMAVLAGLFKVRGRVNAVYATSPPLFVGGAGLILSTLRRCPLFFEVRDLWPESAVQMGILSSRRAIRLATWLEEACYRRARRIVGVTQGIVARLLARGMPQEKLALIPNGANTEIYRPQEADAALRTALGLEPEDFVVIYTGLLGLIHGLETVLEVAELLTAEPQIRFLLVGDGPRKQALKRLALEKSLSNVIFQDAVPEVELPEYIALAAVGLHVQRRLEISKMALPVKMFSYMACQKPVLLAVEGEAAELVRESDSGVVVAPEDPAALAEAVLQLRGDSELRQRLGRNGREVVTARYSRAALAARLADLLEEALN
jgi:glycosyltransferase involved in cell wall biosynthesis